MAKKVVKASAAKNVDVKSKTKQVAPKTIWFFLTRVLLFSLLIISVIAFTEWKGLFNPDYSNDHTRRKWNTYYEFIKKQDVDIVLVGNSHLYTGLNPDNLSNTLGANCFILASPGTTLSDSYYCLKEAIAANKPKIAIVETFTISDYDSHKLRDGWLSDQFKSFSARKNITHKLLSTPSLFNSDNYVPAWSNTIRNHHFIFSDTAQIRTNLHYTEPIKQGLYLGRYNRFLSGIEDSTLMKYERKGFVAFNYTDKMPSDEAKTYIRKIINLCETNNIKLVFLTLPMYHKHVHNYNAYKSELAKYLKGQHWIDFQSPYDSLAFTPACFENTVSGNQHMTYYGALVTAYKVASYLRTNFTNVLPNRSSTMEWKQLFYASDGYFENYPPENDGISKVLLQNTTLPNGSTLKELSFVPSNGAKKLLVKLNKDNTVNMYGKVMKMLVMASINGREEQIELEAQCSMAYAPDSHIVFISAPINPAVELNKILNIRIM